MKSTSPSSRFVIDNLQVYEGPTYATLPYTYNFESATLSSDWTWNVTGAGRVRLPTSAPTPFAGSRMMVMDSHTANLDSTQVADLHIKLADQSNLELGFWWREFDDA